MMAEAERSTINQDSIGAAMARVTERVKRLGDHEGWGGYISMREIRGALAEGNDGVLGAMAASDTEWTEQELLYLAATVILGIASITQKTFPSGEQE